MSDLGPRAAAFTNVFGTSPVPVVSPAPGPTLLPGFPEPQSGLSARPAGVPKEMRVIAIETLAGAQDRARERA
jgi:hypothetical protein